MISTAFDSDVAESVRPGHVNPVASMRRTRSGGTFVRIYFAAAMFLLLLLAASPSKAGENLKINPKLDYTSDSNDGPLITGDHMDAGATQDRVNYVLIYGEGCYNSKRQARRTVALYEKYRGRVNFVIVDLDKPLSFAQSELVKSHYTGSIPHVTVLDKTGKAVYDTAGEVIEQEIGDVLNKALAQ